MPRYIDADDFLDLFYVASAGQDRAFVETVEMVIEDTPTADVEEVVYCEDCKYCDIGENEVDAWCDCRLFKIGCDPLFFCERGERRNDG